LPHQAIGRAHRTEGKNDSENYLSKERHYQVEDDAVDETTRVIITDRHDALDVTEGEISVGLIGSKLARGSQAATRRRIRHDGHFAL
jgi:hypothetical protein